MSDLSPERPLLEHLNELRIRLTWVVASLVVGTVISLSFTRPVLEFLVAPYGNLIQALSPTEPIETYFKVALVCGAILSMPMILYQVWLFVSPGLKSREKRFVYFFIPGAFILFLVGLTFAWYVLVPAAIAFLANFMPTIFNAEWTAREYIGFTTTFLLWIGVSFEMPLVIYLVARTGLVGPRTLREQWRLAIVSIAVIAAAVTPSIDPVTMLLTMVPLTLLYGLSILLAVVGERQFRQQ